MGIVTVEVGQVVSQSMAQVGYMVVVTKGVVGVSMVATIPIQKVGVSISFSIGFGLSLFPGIRNVYIYYLPKMSKLKLYQYLSTTAASAGVASAGAASAASSGAASPAASGAAAPASTGASTTGSMTAGASTAVRNGVGKAQGTNAPWTFLHPE